MKKLTVIFAVCMAVIFFTKSIGQAPEFTETKVYFIDKYLHCLIPITHKIPQDSTENQVKSIIDLLSHSQDSESGFITYVNNEKSQISTKVKGETAYIDLTKKLAESVPADRENQNLFVYQLVNSLCSLQDIKYVRLSVDGRNCSEFFSFLKGEEIFSANYGI